MNCYFVALEKLVDILFDAPTFGNFPARELPNKIIENAIITYL